jgi:AcrR family transcriptional regulator
LDRLGGRSFFSVEELVTPTTPSEQKRTQNPRGQGSHLRQEIVEATARLLDVSGSELTLTIRAIARETGIAAPSVTRQFHDITEIVDIVVAEEVKVFYRLLDEARNAASDPKGRLFALAQAYVDYGYAQPSRYRVLFSRVSSPRWASEGLHMESTIPVMNETFSLVSRSIKDCIDAGLINNVRPDFGAVLLWYSLHGLVSLPHSIPSFPWPDSSMALTEIFDRVLHFAK